MDYGLINLMLRDNGSAGDNRRPLFLFNAVIKFGKGTEYEEIKVVLRGYYRELKNSFDEKGNRIDGAITNERLDEMIYHLEKLVYNYYFLNRFNDF